MSVTVSLVCDVCGTTDRPAPFFQLTKLGVLRWQAPTHFYVDGGTTLCPQHRPDPLPDPYHETWSEYYASFAESDAREGERP